MLGYTHDRSGVPESPRPVRRLRPKASRMKAAQFTRTSTSVSCTITGRRAPSPFELRFDFRGAEPCAKANWALAALLVPAMVSHKDLVEIDGPVSATLHENVRMVQPIYQSWIPHARPVEVRAAEVIEDNTPAGPYEAAFFSGGVDALYTMVRNRHTLTHLILLDGFDITKRDAFFQAYLSRCEKVAAGYGQQFLTVRTNVREWYGKHGDEWGSTTALFWAPSL